MATIREINESKEFYEFLLSSGLQNTSYESFDFFTKYQNISVGCGCQKKNRIKRADEAFVTAIMNSNEAFQKLMKETAGVETMRFYSQGGMFFEI
tara:strand:+ start:4213 stop:4497 length:285 start_codon:yes stop_codon:yes gene_type:complete